MEPPSAGLRDFSCAGKKAISLESLLLRQTAYRLAQQEADSDVGSELRVRGGGVFPRQRAGRFAAC
jgi:hypothetical protein